ncbi:helix-turn-helix transcriptional regulator [Streptomyces thinghirensis]|nr:helix-turn-helix transcriptional regulator [Streptomyces thinghirensis]
MARLVVQGRANRDIAESLVLSNPTVEHHVARIMRKLNVSSRTDIAVAGDGDGAVGAVRRGRHRGAVTRPGPAGAPVRPSRRPRAALPTVAVEGDAQLFGHAGEGGSQRERDPGEGVPVAPRRVPVDDQYGFPSWAAWRTNRARTSPSARAQYQQ